MVSNYYISSSRKLIFFDKYLAYNGYECRLSEFFNMPVLHIEYRLCPEHPLPAAVEDTLTVYRALLRQNISPSQLMIMGESAGGGLVLLTVQAIIDNQLPVPRGAISISPWTDLSMSGDSYTRNQHTDLSPSLDKHWLVSQVVIPNYPPSAVTDPKLSPLFGSFVGFPPLYINVGTAETMEDDSRQVFTKAQESGVDVTFEEGLHMQHIYPAFFLHYPEARNSMNNIRQWIETKYT